MSRLEVFEDTATLSLAAGDRAASGNLAAALPEERG
jgi:hypothetical protein